jgi:basic amino acid/polyamine antiporter, APA family
LNSSTGSGKEPRRALSVFDGAMFLVGVVVGVGLFRTPPLVAASVDSGGAFLLLWALGGLAALAGALCYAELSSAYPSTGGEYHFLTRAYGRDTGLFFAWARGSVIQTGSVAIVAFVYGDYANEVLNLGIHGPALHAASAVTGLTLLNLSGRLPTKRMQALFTGLVLAALLAVVIAALALTFGGGASFDAPPPPPAPATGAAGLAMIFILLTYGGWNEAAYLSGEVREPGRGMVRVLLLGIALIAALYLVVNTALLAVFGLERLRASDAVAADLMRLALGDAGAVALALVVCAAALSTINATIFTGARLYYALGRDVSAVRALGGWDARRESPASAVLLQGGIALALVAFGAGERGGFQAMVDYTAPVFWAFMLLTGFSLLVLRRTDPARPRPFRVPLYPLTPLLFGAICAWLLYSSLAYSGLGALFGLLVLLAGTPFVLIARRTKREAS